MAKNSNKFIIKYCEIILIYYTKIFKVTRENKRLMILPPFQYHLEQIVIL